VQQGCTGVNRVRIAFGMPKPWPSLKPFPVPHLSDSGPAGMAGIRSHKEGISVSAVGCTQQPGRLELPVRHVFAGNRVVNAEASKADRT
jgi:hypothetical protein